MSSAEPSVAPPPAAAVVELLGHDGRVALVQRVTRWPVRIGRSPVCDIVLDDAHLAGEHAELQLAADGRVQLRLLDTRNGGAVAGKRLASGDEATLPAGGAFQLAGQSLRLRTSADELAPEQALFVQPVRHWALLPALLLVMLFFQWVDRWSAVDPDARWVDYATPLLGPLAFVLGWAGLWSLASKLFQHRFPFTTHLRRALLVIVGLQVLEWVLPGVAYALSLPRLMVLDSLALPLAGAALIAWHAHLVWPGARRTLNVGIAALLLLGLGLQVGGRQEQQYMFGPPYLAALPPPALRLASPKPPETLIESLKPLKAELARQARKDNDGAEPEEDGGGE
ncbi:FHA domain-containing protein [Roseateles sp. BYS78W]|uniref:FHA domain-containing protein n=1 Tax=Pelomonas candidula TaxID=3299025 RepID=A0ABW7HIV4_9BURK